RLRQRLAVALGKLLGRMHEAGVFHPDLHPGNLLLQLDPDDCPRLFLIDLHALRLGRPLPWPTSRANLVVFNRWFMLRADRADRLRFWHAYAEARPGFVGKSGSDSTPVMVRDLERRTLASNLGFWRRQDRRCLMDNKYF